MKYHIIKNYKKYFQPEELIKKLHFQQKQLQNCILSNKKQDFFNVFNMRCGTGKTFTALNSMPYYLRNVVEGKIDRKGVLFVIRQTEECDKYADYLNSLFEDNDMEIHKKVAISYHSKKYTDDYNRIDNKKRQELLKKIIYYPIVFISHENYINCAENDKLRQLFSKGRRLLICDESVDICEIVKISTIKTVKEDCTFKEIEQISNVLIDSDKKLFNNITVPLLQEYSQLKLKNENKDNISFNFKINDIKNIINNLELLLKEASTYDYEISNLLKRILKTIKLLYCDTCIINQIQEKGLSEGYIEIKTINRNKKMWTLENNIILDASASIEPKYIFNKKLYHFMNNECVLDYSKWSIDYIYESSTKASKLLDKKIKTPDEKKKIERKYNAYSQIIKDLGEQETLVICSKDEHIKDEEKFNPYKLAHHLPLENIEHFGNITGKRDFGNLKNVLIAHTPIFQDSDYILHYMYYTNKRFEDNCSLFTQSQIQSLGGIYMFDNQDLQDIKEMLIANQMYQAVCRVNREMMYKTKLVIVTKYLGAVLYVRDMLEGCKKCKQNNKYLELFGTGINKINEERKENSQKNQLQKIFKQILDSNIPKEMEYTSIDSYIISVARNEFIKKLAFTEKQLSDSISDNKEFMKDNAIIYPDKLYKNKMFTFILDKPLKVSY